MKYAHIFLALSLACLVAMLQSSSLTTVVFFGWNSVSWGLLATAFNEREPRWLGKNRDGTMQPLVTLAMLPYHALNALSFAMCCLLSREAPAHEIAPGLWLGRRLSRLSPRDRGFLQAMRPRAVLDAAAEMPESLALRRLGPSYRSLPLLDTGAPSAQEMKDAAGWIAARLEQGPVFVHCAMGHGRSATLVAAFLLCSGRAAGAKEALAMIQERRPRIEPSAEQASALLVLEESAAGAGTMRGAST